MAPNSGYLPPPPPPPIVDEPAAVRLARWVESFFEAALRSVERQDSCLYIGIYQARAGSLRGRSTLGAAGRASGVCGREGACSR